MKKIIFNIFLVICTCNEAYSQLNPMGSIYYQNQYLANPAMAGLESGWELNAAFKKQWTTIDRAPSMQAVTAVYGSENKKVGFGILFYNDKAGVVQRTNFKATYAYHLPLNNETTRLDFGLSAGIMDEYANMSEVRGDQGDASIINFNERNLYLDADFGMALRTNALTMQASLPNMKRIFKRDLQRNVVDRSIYMAAISYKFMNDSSKLTSIEPKLVYRGIENYKDIFDIGANFQFNGNKLILSGMYHTTNSITFGAGTTYRNQLTILGQYTTNTSDLRGYTNGEFEIALKYNFKKR